MKPLLAVQLVFGPLVLFSYWWGVSRHQPLVPALWGDMPAGLKDVYVTNMFLAAAGYMPGLVYFLRSEGVTHAFGAGPRGMVGPYLAVLIPSAAWLSLTFSWLESGSTATYWLMRADLVLVALGSLAILRALVTAAPASHLPWLRRAALVGHLPFMLQTAVLDPFIWPLYVHP